MTTSFNLNDESKPWIHRIWVSPGLQALINFVILAAFMGYEASAKIKHAVDHIGEGPDHKQKRQAFWVEVSFTCFVCCGAGGEALVFQNATLHWNRC